MHPVKPAILSIEIRPLIQLQSPVILPSNDIDNLWQASWKDVFLSKNSSFENLTT